MQFLKKITICHKKGLRGWIVRHRRSGTSSIIVRLVGGPLETLVCCESIQRFFGQVARYSEWRSRVILCSTLFDN